MSSKGWISDTVGACVAAGIQEYVVCAGARNLELVSALADYAESGDAGEVRVFSHFDERAAGFFALGRTMENGAPCAVITTSGTAVAELLPAVVEAHYQQRPLVIVSADRPERFRGTGAPQAIEHVGIFSKYVEGCEDIAWVDTLTLFDGWSGKLPWHLNICIEENEAKARLSKVRVGEVQAQRENINMSPVFDCIKNAWKGMVVLLGGLEPEDREEVWHVLRDLGAPVLADSTSGLREALGKLVLVDGDRLLRENPPAYVLRIGEVPVGRYWRDLEELPAVQVVSISRTGYAGLSRDSQVITGDISRCMRALGEISSVGDAMDHLKLSNKRRGKVNELLESLPESEPGMVRMLSVMATMGSSLYLGNSLPIREWNDFAQSEFPYELVRANRGANGIDGQIATWLGATADEENAWGIFGDLTALYDMGAPALLDQVQCQGRMLVVINNGGGQIFSRLPSVQGMDPEVTELVTNEHEHGFESWAKMWKMDYVRVDGMEGFDFEPGDKTTVVEIIPSSRQTETFWAKFEALK
ncbi:2-succinyl-5-enolpyruvyl-6-hydroxy-3-cyclohexene-1-carboxylic-acid synthase [Verrucomicrobiaceae bacterium 5K15]|uniref:2-succinyl-5-enolpyruvyl-6-hydroxy-3-cyclohexene-1-carboxylic-acid synthase n=1 Tax=Oceaniferula flava TaxID=2800421 RepID=A0AAE2VAC9_9BACT|nr:2-succinyl-5-enolpyruvyl-6-hydroxy-3-cyclohexene-1-carboxylic-acid synthase [Oceaniferula flavus]MBK1856573.1 2-succinyl-5-enolpyruvyl-6-hydroxy-3-cyclohexene-1-carboxylic-acid synthase [Oceaniferula flavus]MBM1137880.1 2-succinyl-5-enolpyruvyl-6-hydroxy-3-cyclohexene-1-carboxylic-acid synthase [Oceaniferula flavus]